MKDWTFEKLNELFYYSEDSKTNLCWKLDRQGQIRKDDVAGALGAKGYYVVKIKRLRYAVHRIIWILHNKTSIPEYIDHINGIRTDNRIENLRLATARQNSLNITIPKDNTSGCIGVYYMKRKNKWKVEIRVHDKLNYFGLYEDYADAVIKAKYERERLFGEWNRK